MLLKAPVEKYYMSGAHSILVSFKYRTTPEVRNPAEVDDTPCKAAHDEACSSEKWQMFEQPRLMLFEAIFQSIMLFCALIACG
jgi:hypothetical protein